MILAVVSNAHRNKWRSSITLHILAAATWKDYCLERQFWYSWSPLGRLAYLVGEATGEESTMTNGTPDLSEVKRGMKSAWMAGDFGKIAILTLAEGAEFVGRLRLKPGTRVLDVACGTGNQSLPAARTGAEVTGLDLAPNLLEQARKRAQEE